MSSGPAENFWRLVNGWCAGETLVPFLGAGISYDAVWKDQRDPPSEEPHRYAVMLERLGYKGRTPRKQSLAWWSEAFLWPKGREAVDLCRQLQLHRFTQLAPTRAHLAIAALLAEGSITEVFSTNYDTCLEEAWTTLEVGSVVRTSASTNAKHLPVDRSLWVVTSLREYRHTPGAAPRIYKVNGCAAQYQDQADLAAPPGKPSEAEKLAAERIVLTERQLQNWREHGWARDRFCDRLRQSHVLFSGFGSEEPQIRHTVLLTTGEFSRCDGGGTPPAESLPNAPYVNVFDELSRCQKQLVHGYCDAHGSDIDPSAMSHPLYLAPRRSKKPKAPPQWYRSAVDGQQTTKAKLPADNLWTALYHGWWARQLQHYWSGNGRYAQEAGWHRNGYRIGGGSVGEWVTTQIERSFGGITSSPYCELIAMDAEGRTRLHLSMRYARCPSPARYVSWRLHSDDCAVIWLLWLMLGAHTAAWQPTERSGGLELCSVRADGELSSPSIVILRRTRGRLFGDDPSRRSAFAEGSGKESSVVYVTWGERSELPSAVGEGPTVIDLMSLLVQFSIGSKEPGPSDARAIIGKAIKPHRIAAQTPGNHPSPLYSLRPVREAVQ